MKDVSNRDKASKWGLYGMGGVMAVCCGLHFLFLALGLTAASEYLLGAKNWIIGGSIALFGIAMLVMMIRGRKSRNCACGPAPNKH